MRLLNTTCWWCDERLKDDDRACIDAGLHSDCYEIKNEVQFLFGFVDRATWHTVMIRDRAMCQSCGVTGLRRDVHDPRRLVVDHIFPHHAGGTCDLDNLQVLCKRCNSRKGGKRPWEWSEGWFFADDRPDPSTHNFKRPKPDCLVSDCERPSHARGLCSRHYSAWYPKYGRGAWRISPEGWALQRAEGESSE